MINGIECVKKFLLGLVTLIFVVQLLFLSLGKGGGWDLGQQIAMADRAAVGQIYYSTQQDGFYLSSSPYFPGVSFLSMIVSKLSYEHRETILLVLATSIGIALLLFLAFLAKKMGVKFQTSFALVVMYAVWFFALWKAYMTEFKPDSLLLLGAVGILFLFMKIERKQKLLLFYGLFVVLLVLIGIFKQQGVAIYASVFLYVLFSKSIDLRTKVHLLFLSLSAGLVVLAIVIYIPNCFNNTVLVIMQHPLMPWGQIGEMFLNSFQKMWLFYVPLFLYFGTFIFRKNTVLTKYERAWFFFAFPWMLLSLLSAIKVGGNEGNIEVAVLPFLPYVVLYINRILQKSNEFKLMLYFCALFTFYSLSLKTRREYKHWKQFKEEEKEIVAYLSVNFANKTVLYGGDDYMKVSRSKMRKKTEIDTALTFGLGRYDLSLFYQEINKKGYDVIYCSFQLEWYEDKKMLEFINKNYTSINDSKMPKCLQDRIFIAKK